MKYYARLLQVSICLVFLCLSFSGCSESSTTESNDLPTIDPPPGNLPPITRDSNIEVTDLGSNVKLLRETTETASVNLVLVTGSEGNLIIDSGYNSLAGELRDTLTSIVGGELDYLINTHSDGDHRGGNHVLPGEGTIVGHLNAQGIYQSSNPSATIHSIRENYSFSLNGEQINCIVPAGNGHSNSDLIVYIPGLKIVCTGDIYFSESFPYVLPDRGSSVQGLLTNLDYMSVFFPQDVIFVPGHGRTATHADLDAYINMLRETIDIVREQMNAGRSLTDIQESNVLADYESWGSYSEALSTNNWIYSIYVSYQGG